MTRTEHSAELRHVDQWSPPKRFAAWLRESCSDAPFLGFLDFGQSKEDSRPLSWGEWVIVAPISAAAIVIILSLLALYLLSWIILKTVCRFGLWVIMSTASAH